MKRTQIYHGVSYPTCKTNTATQNTTVWLVIATLRNWGVCVPLQYLYTVLDGKLKGSYTCCVLYILSGFCCSVAPAVAVYSMSTMPMGCYYPCESCFLSIFTTELTRHMVHPTPPVLLTKNGPLRALVFHARLQLSKPRFLPI